MKMSDIRERSSDDLNEQVAQLRAELATERGQSASGIKPENPKKQRDLRHTIARALTIIRERGENR